MARRAIAGVVAVGLVALSAVAGCGGASGSGSAEGTSAAGGAIEKSAALGPAATHAASDTGGTFSLAQDAAVTTGPSVGPKVIKTASLRVEVHHGRFGDAIADASDIAATAGGYVVSTQVGGKDVQFGQVTMRVPADRFSAVLSSLTRRLGDVVSRQESGQDVTADFVDLSARRRNLRAQERVLLRLMSRAETVADTIRVQNELGRIQGEIERISGQLRYLSNQAALSTISVSLREAGVDKAGPPSAIGKAFRDAGHRALGVVTATIEGAGLVIPTALLAAILGFAGWRLWQRFGTTRPRVADADAS
jgi:hypothetical protein